MEPTKSSSIHTVQTLANSEPGFTEGGIRWTIFQHKDELLEAGAIFYNRKKLLIDRDRYIDCLRSGLQDQERSYRTSIGNREAQNR